MAALAAAVVQRMQRQLPAALPAQALAAHQIKAQAELIPDHPAAEVLVEEAQAQLERETQTLTTAAQVGTELRPPSRDRLSLMAEAEAEVLLLAVQRPLAVLAEEAKVVLLATTREQQAQLTRAVAEAGPVARTLSTRTAARVARVSLFSVISSSN